MDNGIDVTTALQPSQLVLIGALLGILLIWMLIFAWLAIRPTPEIRAEEGGKIAPVPGIIPTSAPVKLHTIPSTPVLPLAQEAGGERVLESSTR